MGRIEYNWYFDQTVGEGQMENAFEQVKLFAKDSFSDLISPGFIYKPDLSQHSPTPNMQVDSNIPGASGIVAYNNQGQRIFQPTSQIIDLASVSGGPIVLPDPGNEKYLTILIGFTQFETDPKIDGYGDTIYYQREDGYVFTMIQGTQATAGSAALPADPDDGRLIMGDILIDSTTTAITDAMINQDRVKTASLNAIITGFNGASFLVNIGAQGVPTAGAESFLGFKRGSKIAASFRLLEGADPSTDPPVIQIPVFTDSDTFTYEDMATQSKAGGWTDSGTYLIPTTPTQPIKHGSAGAPDASAYFQAESTSKGFAGIPGMTTAQRNAIPSPMTRLLIYNTDTNTFDYWTGAAWLSVGVGAGSGGEITVSEPVTLTAGMISAGEYVLNFTPSNGSAVRWHLIEGPTYQYGVHFNVVSDGSTVRKVTFDPVALSLSEGDVVNFVYPVGNPGTVPVAGTNVSISGMAAMLTGLSQMQEIAEFLDAMTDDNLALNATYTGNLTGALVQSDVNDLLDSLVDEHVSLFDTYAGNLAGMQVQGEVNDWLDALSLGGAGGPSIMGGNFLLVDPSHPDSADDTDKTTPFNTIQQAHDQAAANDVILIAPGTYSESPTFTKSIALYGLDPFRGRVILSGTLTTSTVLLLKNMKVTTVTITNIPTTGMFAAVNCEFTVVNISGIDTNTSIYLDNVRMLGQFNHSTSSFVQGTIKNCYFQNASTSNFRIVNSDIFNCDFYAPVNLVGPSGSLITRIRGCKFLVATTATTVLALESTGSTVNAEVSNCHIEHSNGSSKNGILLTAASTGSALNISSTSIILGTTSVSINYASANTLNLRLSGVFSAYAESATGGGSINKTVIPEMT